jgi:hypothetical protein
LPNLNPKTDSKILEAASIQIVELLEELGAKGIDSPALELQLRDLGVRLLKLKEDK